MWWYATIPAIHQRQEGMSSCLRDLVIKRLQLGLEEPLTYLVRGSLGEPSICVNNQALERGRFV